jgi:drug/metabolite transporter (DMT)-like permease
VTLAAGCLLIATTFMVVALRTGQVSVVVPFRYVPAPLSILLGWWWWWWWNEVPDRIACLGIVLVLAAGLYVLDRERLSLTSAKITSADRSPAE